jgi:hypothetical protein
MEAAGSLRFLTTTANPHILESTIQYCTGSLVTQAERRADSPRPAEPDPDNAGGGNEEKTLKLTLPGGGCHFERPEEQSIFILQWGIEGSFPHKTNG